ncbi:reverse transcriptase domain-containing protein [Tanacetum coccineum]
MRLAVEAIRSLDLILPRDGEARDWLDKKPPRSILTWDDLVLKFINQFFPPSKTTYLRNEITTFYQKPNETFNEAWERFKGLLRQCLAIIESKSKVRYSRSRPNDSRAITNAPSSPSSPSNNSFEIQQIAALLEDIMNIRMSHLEKAINEKNATTPATIKAVEEAPTPQIQGVSKTDFENYVKANDAVLKNVQNQGQNLQNQMANVMSLLTSLCDNFKNPASTSNSGTLPSQTVTNPRQQINAITTRSGKTLEGPSTPLVPTPVVSKPQKEPEQNPETSTEKVQNPNLENTAHVPPPEEEESIFMEIPKPKAKKTVNVEIQDLNSPRPNSYPSKLPYPERMKVRENDKPSAQHSRFLKMFNTTPFIINERCSCRNAEVQQMVKLVAKEQRETRGDRHYDPLIDLYEETLTLRVGKEELVYYADKSEKNKNKHCVHAISVIDFSKDDPFSGSTTTHSDDPSPSSSPVKTSDNFEKFADELALLDSLPPGNDDSTLKKVLHEENFQVNSNPLFEFDDNFKSSTINPLFDEMEENVEIKNSNVSDEPVLLNTPLSDKVECFAPEDNNDEIDDFLAMEVSSNLEEGYFDSEGDNDREFEEYLSLMTVLCETSTSQSQGNVHANQSSVIESLPESPIPVEDSTAPNKRDRLFSLIQND